MKRIETKSGLIAFLALLLVLCTMLGVLFTQGRYVKNAESGSDIYGSDMNFIVSEQIEVNTVEEFIAAVENGYSNIKISDEVENPLIITSGVTDVGADLILDLNGHEIQRNNREPMLNIVDGVRMTIIDSSRSQAGSFYNPVGSVLQIGGGTLTVTAGAFVSGPKKSEYAQQSGSAWTAGAAVNGTGGAITGSAAVRLYTRGEGGYTYEENVTIPVITPVVDNQNGELYVNGNMYFDEGTAPAGYPGVLQEDTYLYYVVGDATVTTGSILADTNTADFYYTYNVVNTAAEGAPPVYEQRADGDILVTVYGYYHVKATAQNKGDPVSGTGGTAGMRAEPDNSFATIRMTGGNMYVRGGSYTTNFGCGTAYGLFATGGYMAVETGTFAAIEEGVCIECNYFDPSEEEYLRVSGGTFSSQNGDTVRVYSGEMVVTGGSFIKNSTRAASDEETPSAAMTAAVRVRGGALTASNAAFLLSGSAQYGIYSEPDENGKSGTVRLTDVGIQFVADTSAAVSDTNRDTSVSHNYGVYAAADITLNGRCTVDVSGAGSGGLLAEGGNITYGNTRPGTLHVTMRMDTGKTSLSSSAIAAVDGKITFNGTGSQVIVKSDGIGVAVRRQETSSQAEAEERGIELTAGSMNITTTRATALYVSGGSAVFNKDTTVTIDSKIDGSCTVPLTDENGSAATGTMYHGVFVQGGSLDASGATLVTHRGTENVIPSGTAFTVHETYTMTSYAVYVDAGAQDAVNITSGTITNSVGGGIYVGGGTVTLGTTQNFAHADLQIRTTGGVDDDTNANDWSGWYGENRGYAGNWPYRLSKSGGNAVDVDGGILTIHGGIFTANQGNGIVVRGGGATIGNGYFYGNDVYKAWEDNDGAIAGPGASYAFKVYGGTATVNGGTFGRQVSVSEDGTLSEGSYSAGSGAFVMGTDSNTLGKAEIWGGTFEVSGQAGFSIYQHADVTFGRTGASNADLTVAGGITAMALEKEHSTNTQVTINSGTFTGKNESGDVDGIWYGNAAVTLTVNGGQFTGHARSGLFFDVDPGTNVQISAGTFYGGDPSSGTIRWEWWTCYYNGGGIGITATESWGTITDYIDVNISDILAPGSYISQTSETGLVGRYLSQHTTVNVVKR